MRMLYPHKKVELRKEFYEPAVLYPEFTKEDITVFIMIFREFDEDSSGSISAAELDKAFKSMGQGCTPEDIQQIINTVDADNSGEIECESIDMTWHFFAQIVVLRDWILARDENPLSWEEGYLWEEILRAC